MARKKMPWFRFYAETVTDRKIRRLRVEHRWLWVVVLCAARQSPIEGYLLISEREPIEAADLADLGAMPEKTVEAGFVALDNAGLIAWDTNLGAWMVPKWAERQFKSDNSTERVKKHRSSNGGGNDDGTFHGGSSNGHGNGPETEADPDPQSDPDSSSSSVNGFSNADGTVDDLIQSHIEAHYRWKLLDENPIRSLERFSNWARPRMAEAIGEARLSGQDPQAALEMNWPTHADGVEFDPGAWNDPDVPLYLRGA